MLDVPLVDVDSPKHVHGTSHRHWHIVPGHRHVMAFMTTVSSVIHVRIGVLVAVRLRLGLEGGRQRCGGEGSGVDGGGQAQQPRLLLPPGTRVHATLAEEPSGPGIGNPDFEIAEFLALRKTVCRRVVGP
jgi:hypothetical protein